MPNRRTSLFYVNKEDFHRFLDDVPDAAEIAMGMVGNVTTSEVRRRLAEQEGDKVPIDEQDHSWYIVNFEKPYTGPPPEKRSFFRRLKGRQFTAAGKAEPLNALKFNPEDPCISVDESSPLHGRLRQCHIEWLDRSKPR